MSAFSRGCLLRHQFAINLSSKTPHIFSRSSLQHARFFSAAPIFRVARKTSKLPLSTPKVLQQTKPSYNPVSSSGATTNNFVSYAHVLSHKMHPTVLYEAPSHTALMVASYSTTLFCFSWASVTYWNSVQNAPAGLPFWVPHVFTLFSSIVFLGGLYVMRAPWGLIRRVTALPKSMQVATGNKTAAATSDLQIEIELKKAFPLPFLPARKIYVSPAQLSLPSPLSAPINKVFTPAQQRAMQKENELLRQKELEYERTHLLTQPFRHMSRGAFSFFKEMKRMFHNEGFTRLSVDGRKYKLDIADGWALDNGRALDRLIGRKIGV